jgi:hypothetical protein
MEGEFFYLCVRAADGGEFFIHQSKQLMEGSSLLISQGCCLRGVLYPSVRAGYGGGFFYLSVRAADGGEFFILSQSS